MHVALRSKKTYDTSAVFTEGYDRNDRCEGLTMHEQIKN
jgi:hypothetical protein